VKPGAKPEEIQDGPQGFKGDQGQYGGELVVETVLGEVKFTKPVAYQEVGGQKNRCGSGLSSSNSEFSTPNSQHIYGFKLGGYDETKELSSIRSCSQPTSVEAAKTRAMVSPSIHPQGMSMSQDTQIRLIFQGGRWGGYNVFRTRMPLCQDSTAL